MNHINQINMHNKKKVLVLSLFLGVLLLSPIFVFSSHKNSVYVDAGAKENNADGSKDHPFRTIREALGKANKGTAIHVANGEYHERISLKKGVNLFGEDRDKTIIKGHGDDPVVMMYDNTKITDFTIKNGRDGVRIDGNAEASIINCDIKDNDDDGIYVEQGDMKEDHQVVISGNSIKNNDRAGIFSKQRRVVITDNTIQYNGSDGVDLSFDKASSWIGNNFISNNKGSGMKFKIDGSNIWMKGNNIRNNSREGIEVAFWGGAGHINIEKTKIIGNGRFGIAKLQSRNARGGADLWNKYLTFNGLANDIRDNQFGSFSSIIINN
jgi:hypothetical protein